MTPLPNTVGSHLANRKDRMDSKRESRNSSKGRDLPFVSYIFFRKHRQRRHLIELYHTITHIQLFPALTSTRCTRRFNPRCKNIRKWDGHPLIHLSIHTRQRMA